MSLPRKYSYLTYKIYGKDNDEYIEIVRCDNSVTSPIIPAYIDNIPVKVIGEKAFANSRITSIQLPETLERIKPRAFSMCSDLSSLSIPDSVKKVGDAFCSFCGKLKDVKWSSGAYSIPTSAFHFCVSLKEITNIDSIRAIYGFAFYSTDLRNIKLPPSVAVIDTNAFGMCLNLKSIRITSKNPPLKINPSAFDKTKNITFDSKSSNDAKRYAFMHDIPIVKVTLNDFLNDIEKESEKEVGDINGKN